MKTTKEEVKQLQDAIAKVRVLLAVSENVNDPTIGIFLSATKRLKKKVKQELIKDLG